HSHWPDPLEERSSQDGPARCHYLSQICTSDFLTRKGQHLTIERALQDYLQAHRAVGHRQKTLEWHQMVLGHLQQYLQTECHLLHVHQITEKTVRNWLSSLAQTPTPKGSRRSASTIETYARSARAFCGWLVERGTLSCSPMSESAFPRTSVPLPHVISPATFDQIMRTGFSQKARARETKRLATRDQALLWVLFDTGITVAELCALRIADLDWQTGWLRVRRKGGKERQMPLGSTCLSHLRVYLKQMDPTTRRGLARRHAGGDPLFASQGKQSLTTNDVSMVFARFRKRARISDTVFSPQVLRHSFALRYLRAGGNPWELQELLGYEGMAPVRQYLRWYNQLLHEQTQPEREERGGSVTERTTPLGSRPDEEGRGEKIVPCKKTPDVRASTCGEETHPLVSQAPG
ncbi:MAG: tyrosine-type recombinase/integrase, partial [Ktedonobacteraceae bacterium]|nr:tyrosine-type recombinase/integrase [Ktedonobacteraceae bacterium]